jgi:hypothetical protein
VFLALFAGCDGEENLMRDPGTAYFTLKKGLYHVYAVNEIRHSASAAPEVLNYEIMTEVVDSFPSAQGDYTYVIHRSRRASEGEPWEQLDTWSARKDKSEVIVSEGNIPFVKVSFPLREDTRWDGNAFNTIGVDEYELKDINQPREVNGMTFEITMTIEQERNEDVIVYRDERSEVYALDVGLIYKEVIQLNYCTNDDCLGQQKVDHGLEMKMVIKQYGRY